MTPFEQWFSSDWQKAMRSIADDAVMSSGLTIRTASWDRKAAYLLWVERGRPAASYPSLRNPAPPAVEVDPFAALLAEAGVKPVSLPDEISSLLG